VNSNTCTMQVRSSTLLPPFFCLFFLQRKEATTKLRHTSTLWMRHSSNISDLEEGKPHLLWLKGGSIRTHLVLSEKSKSCKNAKARQSLNCLSWHFWFSWAPKLVSVWFRCNMWCTQRWSGLSISHFSSTPKFPSQYSNR